MTGPSDRICHTLNYVVTFGSSSEGWTRFPLYHFMSQRQSTKANGLQEEAVDAWPAWPFFEGEGFDGDEGHGEILGADRFFGPIAIGEKEDMLGLRPSNEMRR
jgi:hypothetical protein